MNNPAPAHALALTHAHATNSRPDFLPGVAAGADLIDDGAALASSGDKRGLAVPGATCSVLRRQRFARLAGARAVLRRVAPWHHGGRDGRQITGLMTTDAGRDNLLTRHSFTKD
jgi:hypothetical protein